MMSSALPLALAALLLSGSAAIAQAPATPAPGRGAAARPAARRAVVSLSAVFAGDPKPIRSGLVWRVFDDKGDAGQPAVVARSTEAAPNLSLPPGAYIVHAAYGFAGATKRLTVQGGAVAERLTISAGALKLSGAIGDAPIPPNRVSFSVFVPLGNNSEGRLVRAQRQGGRAHPPARRACTMSSRPMGSRTPSCAPTSRSTRAASPRRPSTIAPRP